MVPSMKPYLFLARSVIRMAHESRIVFSGEALGNDGYTRVVSGMKKVGRIRVDVGRNRVLHRIIHDGSIEKGRVKKEEKDYELSMNERISGLTIDSKSIIKVQNLL